MLPGSEKFCKIRVESKSESIDLEIKVSCMAYGLVRDGENRLRNDMRL